jgi:glycosyltransferase involved in cell wall biosynthesis
MKVSVCMTAYNQDHYISEAIESVIYQATKFPYELVIGEDHSTDKTLDICLHHQNRHPRMIGVYPRHKNLGLARNLALTWAECRGDYIAMLEGDDIWCSPLKLQKQAVFLDSHPEYSMCFTLTDINSDQPNRHDQWPYRKNLKETLTASDILKHNLIANCSVMYRKAFPVLPAWLQSLPYCDICLHALHALNGPIGYIPELMATYRLHKGSAFESLPLLQRVKSSSVLYAALIDHLPPPYCHDARQTLLMMYLALHQWNNSAGEFGKLPLKHRLTWPLLPAEQLYHLWKVR